VVVYAHELFDNVLKAQMEALGLVVHQQFSTMFYKHFHDGTTFGPAGLQRYVRKLCVEYEEILLKALNQGSEQRHILFFPCLNWEHAWALNIALQKHTSRLAQSKVCLVCCAMYSPIEQVQSNKKKPWYRLGFRQLNTSPHVRLYCSEFELCQAYQLLLDCEPISHHPCYLMDWQQAEQKLQKTDEFELPNNTVLLYLGDAKVDKGFNRLPNVLQQALANSDEYTHFLIQYTLAWEFPELDVSLKVLKDWAKTEPRLILHHGFWSNQQMTSVMKQIKLAVCTYDTQVYLNKSSGLLWMLAYFDCPFIIDAPCWLTREAKRLGVTFQISPNLGLQTDRYLQISEAEQAADKQNSLSYRQTMYEPLINWLIKL
jgi:hypothetical protein